jgi:hypothetical protein
VPGPVDEPRAIRFGRAVGRRFGLAGSVRFGRSFGIGLADTGRELSRGESRAPVRLAR